MPELTRLDRITTASDLLETSSFRKTALTFWRAVGIGNAQLLASGQAVLTYQIGTSFPMRRRIETPIGGDSLAILDDIEKIGTSGTEMMFLYQTKFGFPAFGENTTVALNGLSVLQALRLGRNADIECHNVSGQSTTQTELKLSSVGPWRDLTVKLRTQSTQAPCVQL